MSISYQLWPQNKQVNLICLVHFVHFHNFADISTQKLSLTQFFSFFFFVCCTCWPAGRSRSPGWWRTERRACACRAAREAAAWSPPPTCGAGRRRASAAPDRTEWRASAARWAAPETPRPESEAAGERERRGEWVYSFLKGPRCQNEMLVTYFGLNKLEGSNKAEFSGCYVSSLVKFKQFI